MCPNTGLPLGHPAACPNCGQAARPGARYCANCGQFLAHQQPPTAGENDALESHQSAALDSTGGPADPSAPAASHDEIRLTFLQKSQQWTRPSVSQVEISRRATRRARSSPTTLQRARDQWRQGSRLWHLIAYTLLILVLLAGAAGLFLLLSQLL